MKKVRPNVDVDADDLNAAFLRQSSDILPAYSSQNVCKVRPFSYWDVLKLLKSSKSSSAAGPDDLHPALFNFGAASLAGAITSIVNESLHTSTIPDCWRPVTIIPIPKASKSCTLFKRFRPIALTSSALELTEKAILNAFSSP
ncbi:unnamed protein product [Echinostoma caproni]|uniref:Uncharacterized protein n=1 Tax=Echinostoma caproni TaxID=27848 RepID=A0A183AEZ2_9TREM|nr:unnamed protein product [Echinostoma caproni]